MKSHQSVQRIPWQTIGWILAGTAVVAWAVGFVIGLIVQFGAWIW